MVLFFLPLDENLYNHCIRAERGIGGCGGEKVPWIGECMLMDLFCYDRWVTLRFLDCSRNVRLFEVSWSPSLVVSWRPHWVALVPLCSNRAKVGP